MELENKDGQPTAENGLAAAEEAAVQNQDKVGFGRLLLWCSRSVSAGIIVLIMGFLMIYCTDTLMIPAALVSALMIGSKLIDGVTDAIAGFIVDKTKRNGARAGLMKCLSSVRGFAPGCCSAARRKSR